MCSQSAAAEDVDADLASPRFLAGVARGYWRKHAYKFPYLIMSVSAVEPTGSTSEYFFRFELNGFRATAPEAQIWDVAGNTILSIGRRPKGSQRIEEAFKSWGGETIYRPWARAGSDHNDWVRKHPDLAWHSKRDLTFALEDLHGLLTSNALTHRSRASA